MKPGILTLFPFPIELSRKNRFVSSPAIEPSQKKSVESRQSQVKTLIKATIKLPKLTTLS